MWTPSQLAKQAGVGRETLRYYEREGLLPYPHRTPSGYRQYDARALETVLFIKRAQALGFSLGEVRELMALDQRPETLGAVADVKRLAERKLADIREKLATLHRLEAVLDTLVQQCQGSGPMAHCPIMAHVHPSAPRKEPT